MKKTDSIHFLKEGDGRVTGTAAYNRLLALITRMSSTTIDIDVNSAGGLRLEVNDYIVGGLSSSLFHTFKGTISGTTLTVSAGKIFLPTWMLGAQEEEFSCNSTEYCYYVECTRDSATISRDTSFHTLMDTSEKKLYLPLFVASSSGIVYRHIGDYVLSWLPYFWMSSYDSSKAQVLYHTASSDEPSWIDTGVCDE